MQMYQFESILHGVHTFTSNLTPCLDIRASLHIQGGEGTPNAALSLYWVAALATGNWPTRDSKGQLETDLAHPKKQN